VGAIIVVDVVSVDYIQESIRGGCHIPRTISTDLRFEAGRRPVGGNGGASADDIDFLVVAVISLRRIVPGVLSIIRVLVALARGLGWGIIGCALRPWGGGCVVVVVVVAVVVTVVATVAVCRGGRGNVPGCYPRSLGGEGRTLCSCCGLGRGCRGFLLGVC
jgi:hypothetical protein